MTEWCYWCPTCGWVEEPTDAVVFYCDNACAKDGFARSFGLGGTPVEMRDDRDALAMALELAKLLDCPPWPDLNDRIDSMRIADWLRAQVIQALREGQ